MQKFTRPITREIEVDGDRLALTFEDKGLSFRLVGTRRQPVEISWRDLIPLAVFQGKSPPTPEDVSRALDTIGGGNKAGTTEAVMPAEGTAPEQPEPELASPVPVE